MTNENKLTEKQQEITERMFQLNHAYFLLDGTKSLELPSLLSDRIRSVQLDIEHEINELRKEVL